jgi:predicted Zn-dependent peptidase
MGFHSPSYRKVEFFAAQVLSGVLGGGMSSRLFQEIRERRGLCYAIYTSAWGLKDTGLFAVHAATGDKLIEELIDVVSDEIDKMADLGPSAAEVSRAKAQLKSGLLMSLESSSARAEQLARQMLLHGRLLPTSELIAAIDRVTERDVQDIGAGRRSQDLAARAANRLSCRASYPVRANRGP